MTLRSRVFALLGLLLALLAVDAFQAITSIGERDRLVLRIDRLDRAREASSTLLAAYVDQESGLRSYVITADQQFLPPYDQGIRAAEASLRRLRRELATTPEFLARVTEIEGVAARWREEAAIPELRAVEDGRLDDAREIVASGVGRDHFQELRTLSQDLRTALREAEDALDMELTAARDRLSDLVLRTFVVGVGLVLLTAFLIWRWLTIPLRQITESLRAVAGGQLDRKIPTVGPPELSQAGTDAEAMRRRIVDELAEAVRAREALEQRGPVVLNVRHYLAPSTQVLPHSLSVTSRFEPAEGIVAGDWYDVLTLDDHTVALTVADVAGHGPAAGVLALRSKQLVIAALRDGRSPGAALDWVADQLGDTDESFLTCAVVAIDIRTGACRYASAGHFGLLVAGGVEVQELAPTGPLLGPFPGEWETREFTLGVSAMLFAFTDGLIEARDAAGEEFGMDRLGKVLRAGTGIEAVATACLDEVREFTEGRLRDDITIVALTFAPARVGA